MAENWIVKGLSRPKKSDSSRYNNCELGIIQVDLSNKDLNSWMFDLPQHPMLGDLVHESFRGDYGGKLKRQILTMKVGRTVDNFAQTDSNVIVVRNVGNQLWTYSGWHTIRAALENDKKGYFAAHLDIKAIDFWDRKIPFDFTFRNDSASYRP